jgi:hypothetical protein
VFASSAGKYPSKNWIVPTGGGEGRFVRFDAATAVS